MEDEDVFKREFKRFKRPSDDDMKTDVIDFENPDSFIAQIVPVKISRNFGTISDRLFGLIPHYDWQVYRLKSVPGLIFIKNPFLPGHQHKWVVKCLTDYPLLPNICNLDSHTIRKGMGDIWPMEDKSILRNLQNFKDSLLYKLRWVTLGYHYNWTTKLYSHSNQSPFPEDLSCLSEYMLSMIGYKKFKAEAAIVNYYHLDSTLSGHTDHSEKDLEAPLISISFGQSAIFLIGGRTKQDIPVPLLLNSGDIVIMSGESRLAYHGVPKVIQSTELDGIPKCLSTEQFEQALKDYETDTDSDGDYCSLCGRNPYKYTPITKTQETNDNVVKERKRSRHSDSNREEDMSCSKMTAMSTSGLQEDCPAKKKVNDCSRCSWILNNWKDFKFYLPHSRININIRQVGVITD